MKNLNLTILVTFILNLPLNVYSEECKKNNPNTLDYSKILVLANQVNKVCSDSESPKSKWMAHKISNEDCAAILKQINENKLDSALIPEILTAVDIVKAECEGTSDPKVVVKDVMPFTIDGSKLYFSWDDNNKLIVKNNYEMKSDDYISVYAAKDLFSTDSILNENQKKMVSTLDLKELKSSNWKEKGIVKKWWESTKNNVLKILVDGETDMYIPMIAYHDRNTYDAEHIKNLNEAALGIGVGKSIINEKGNSEMLFAMAHLDSHSQVEFNVGYGWQKNFNVTDKTKVGIGYAAGVISREDLNNRIPIPFILPMASVTYDKKISLNGVLIPKLDGGINHGAVVFIFGKYTFDK
jgi:palmitoyl transferase